MYIVMLVSLGLVTIIRVVIDPRVGVFYEVITYHMSQVKSDVKLLKTLHHADLTSFVINCFMITSSARQ